jgi:hypothetical protein
MWDVVMDDRDPLPRLRDDLEPIATPVEQVMQRGRVIRRRRRHIRDASLAASTLVVVLSLVFGVQAFATYHHHGRTITVTTPSPTVTAPSADVAVPINGRCSAGVQKPVDQGLAPQVDVPALPAGSRSGGEVGSSTVNCAVPPVALLLVAWNPQHDAVTAAVALWGPHAVTAGSGSVTSPSASASPSAGGGASVAAPPDKEVAVRDQIGRLVVTPLTTQLSWREPDGTAWVLTGNGKTQADLISIADAIAIGASSKGATLADPAHFGLSVESAQVFPEPASTATQWRTSYVNGGSSLDVTVIRNGVNAVGPLVGALQAPSGLNFTAVRGHVAIAGVNGSNQTFLTWPETSTETITLLGSYSTAELRAIAESLVIR